MRRAKSKFRPAVGGSGSPAIRSPLVLPVELPVDPVPADESVPVSPPVQTEKENKLWIGPQIHEESVSDCSLELSLIPVDGNEIEPPDGPDDDEDIDEALFKFKVPPPESGIVKKVRKKKDLDSSCSSSNRSSRAEAIIRRKKAEENLENNTADGGNIDRTEVSMSDLIFVGSKCGTHEMGFAKRLREQREAKERATTVSQLSGGSGLSKKSDGEGDEPGSTKVLPQIVRPKVRVIDGKVVVDKSSLYQTIDEAPAELNEEILEDFETMPEGVNSLSFRNRKHGKRSKNWSDDETDRFYEAITIVGNDFVALAGAFTRRNAAEIKRKFVRENKQNSAKIDQLLSVHSTGESTWDLTHLRDRDVQYHQKLDEIEEKKKVRRERRIQRQLDRQENNNDPKAKRVKKVAAEYSAPSSVDLDDLIPIIPRCDKDGLKAE